MKKTRRPKMLRLGYRSKMERFVRGGKGWMKRKVIMHAYVRACVRACIPVLSSSIQSRYHSRIATTAITTSTVAVVSAQ